MQMKTQDCSVHMYVVMFGKSLLSNSSFSLFPNESMQVKSSDDSHAFLFSHIRPFIALMET